MLDSYELRPKVHVVLRDNAANMSKAMMLAGLPSTGCFAHSLQLCIQKPLTSRAATLAWLSNLLATCRALVGHFSHSVLAKQKLRAIQSTMPDCPKRKLIQYVQTRWNSTYYMLRSIADQETALAAYERSAGSNLPVAVPQAYQFRFMRQLVTLLEPLEEITRKVCSARAHAGDVIPCLKAISLNLENCGDDVERVKESLQQQLGTTAVMLNIFVFAELFITALFELLF